MRKTYTLIKQAIIKGGAIHGLSGELVQQMEHRYCGWEI
jgi:hypothetical protein